MINKKIQIIGTKRNRAFLLFLLFLLNFSGSTPSKFEKTKIQKVEYSIKLNSLDTISNTFTDNRDGQVYLWVELKDGKKWMAQNLNYNSKGSWCYDNDANNCKKFGRLYNWESASKACPTGWHLSSNEEWQNMANQYGGASITHKDTSVEAYNALTEPGNFQVQFGGHRQDNGKFGLSNLSAGYWTSAKLDAKNVWMYNFLTWIKRLKKEYSKTSWAYSCRCVKDE